MRTMRRHLFFASVAGVFALFAGCGGGEDSVEGAWRAHTLSITDAAGMEQCIAVADNWTELLTLNPDGTFTFNSTQNGRVDSGAGLWRQTDQQLTLDYRGTSQIVFELADDRLLLHGSIPEGVFILTWTRVD